MQSRRKKKRFPDQGRLNRRRLTDQACPTQFHNVTPYLSKTPKAMRTENASSSTRCQKEEETLNIAISKFLEADKFRSLDELNAKLDRSTIPHGMIEIRRENAFVLMYVKDQDDGGVQIICQLSILQDCSFVMKMGEMIAPKKIVAHVTKNEKVNCCSDVVNILSALKVYSEEFDQNPESIEVVVQDFITKVSRLSISDDRAPRFQFLLEQLTLALCHSKKQRRYSSDLLASSCLWLATSPALYRQLIMDNILCLPSISYLKLLTRPMDASTGLSEKIILFLKERLKSLDQRQKLMVLMADEIYCSQRTEFVGGNFFGLTDKSYVKTVLVFMIKSIAGKFSKTVALYPMTTLDSKIMKTTTNEVLISLNDLGCKILLMSVDNASANRKLFIQEFCNGTLQTSIPNPANMEEPLFLSFDAVHCFKNLRNNFATRKNFECPNFDGTGILQPTFFHLEELYQLEKGKPVKMAFKLTHKVLYPTSIEKTNVMLADSLFHDSTISAMEFFVVNGQKPQWRDTVEFLKIVRHWWNIVNVKTPHQGIRKRDPRKIPVLDKDSQSLTFLNQFEEWLNKWDELDSSKKIRCGLTKETLMATRQTTKVLAEIAIYLLEKEKFVYVLLGQLQSDVIEGRFSWIRQLGGGNYFLSIRQILEADKSIKIRSLVRYSRCSIKDLKQVFANIDAIEERVVKERSIQLELLVPHVKEDISNIEDKNILFYIAGYLGRSLSRKGTCDECKELFAKPQTLTVSFEDGVSESDKMLQKSFLEQVSRGALVHPSDILYTFSLLVWSYYTQVQGNKAAKECLMSSKNQREVFVLSFLKRVEDTEELCNAPSSTHLSIREWKLDGDCSISFQRIYVQMKIQRFMEQKNGAVKERKVLKKLRNCNLTVVKEKKKESNSWMNAKVKE